MVERTLSQRALNRALLARQLLLERADLPLVRAVERLGGLQTQYAPSPYIGLWSRLEGFQRDSLTRALERRTVIQGTLMRSTIHMVSRRDYEPMVEGVRAARRTDWLRATRHAVDARRMASVARRVRSLLADGPRKRKDIQDELGIDTPTWNGVGLWVDLVRVPPSDSIRRRSSRCWTLRWFRSEAGEELLDLPQAPLPDPAAPAPEIPPDVGCDPARPCAPLADPAGAAPSRGLRRETPHSESTFLVDGQVAGTWRFEEGRMGLDAFDLLPRSTRHRLQDEADRLALFMD